MKFQAGHPAIFPREEKIEKEIQNNRYAHFFIPQTKCATGVGLLQ